MLKVEGAVHGTMLKPLLMPIKTSARFEGFACLEERMAESMENFTFLGEGYLVAYAWASDQVK